MGYINGVDNNIMGTDYDDDSNSVQQVDYNLSAMKTFQIGKLLATADEYFTHGFLEKAFFQYKCIWIHIAARLTDDQFNKCKKLEKGLIESLKLLDYSRKKLYLSYYYEKYTLHIQRMLKTYGFDIRDKEEKMF